MGNCAGIDWASEKHDALIEDPAGEELLAAAFGHDEDGVSALCAALACFEVEVVASADRVGLQMVGAEDLRERLRGSIACRTRGSHAVLALVIGKFSGGVRVVVSRSKPIMSRWPWWGW